MKLKIKATHKLPDGRELVDEFETDAGDPWMKQSELKNVAWCAAMKRLKSAVSVEPQEEQPKY